MSAARKRVLVFVVAYNAESTILDVLARIPDLEALDVEVLVIDDASADGTYALTEELARLGPYRHRLTVLVNPSNQGYGGNQKLGYQYAISGGFDVVVLLHGDGQYAPELIADLATPVALGVADVVHGSRMLKPMGALRGGMPAYKFLGNKLLTWYQNLVLGSHLSEFHTGYKAYSVAALRRIPFHRNSNVFHFDTEIIIQWMRAGARITEVPIPTHYGDEVCRVNGLRYARDVTLASTAAFLMRFGLLYRRNFDVGPQATDNSQYESKLGFPSSHSYAAAEVPAGSRVLDLGCGAGHLARALRARGCRVVGVDRVPPPDPGAFDEFILADLGKGPLPRAAGEFDVILLLDVVDHLASPERFLDELRVAAQDNLNLRIVITAPNIGFIVTRLSLLLGQFNYNRRGILDLAHTRLRTFASFRRVLSEAGFAVESLRGVPAPVPLVLGSPSWCRVLMGLQVAGIRLWRNLFSFQIIAVTRPLPTLPKLLGMTEAYSQGRAAACR
ncbi:MAG TPA: bifunctional glycosyltransferase/class I SAM-dependent methyltransferase [Opitutaceae bacterium]|jgi:glycosyltransferase involved in cell wall biosynthesis